MANNIVLKKSSVPGKVPQAGDLAYGELAINYADGLLHYKRSDNTIHSIGGAAGSETDPIYTASSWYTTTNNSSNWDAAYSWGNHASAGYLNSGSIGTTVQGYSTNLTSWASLATNTKQDTLVSGNNIKTINGSSILGSGNLEISGGGGGSPTGFEQTFLLMGA